LRVDLHNLNTTLGGKSYRGKIFRRIVHHYCHKPSCPVCFKSGWCVRLAGTIEGRLAEASKRFGQVEHIVASVPPHDYGLSLEALRTKVYKILSVRGVLGGNVIFHGMRYNKRKSWYFSPHVHVLAFVLGGYGKCRRCKNNVCVGRDRFGNSNFGKCTGFKARTRQLYEKDGYIVRVLGKRKTVFGTAYYQLTHATIDITKNRFHVSTWWGVCSYRKMKITPKKRRELCPVCSSELVGIDYLGVKHVVTDKNACNYERDAFEDYEENGFPAWAEKVKPYYG